MTKRFRILNPWVRPLLIVSSIPFTFVMYEINTRLGWATEVGLLLNLIICGAGGAITQAMYEKAMKERRKLRQTFAENVTWYMQRHGEFMTPDTFMQQQYGMVYYYE